MKYLFSEKMDMLYFIISLNLGFKKYQNLIGMHFDLQKECRLKHLFRINHINYSSERRAKGFVNLAT